MTSLQSNKQYIKTLQKVAEAQEDILYMRFKWGMPVKRALKRLLATEMEISKVDLTQEIDWNNIEGINRSTI